MAKQHSVSTLSILKLAPFFPQLRTTNHLSLYTSELTLAPALRGALYTSALQVKIDW